MAVNWFASFKDIPWARVLEVAPSIAEGARNLWQRVASKPGQGPDATPVAQAGAKPDAEVLAALEVRVVPLERRTTKLEDEARSSFEVVKSMAEQHSQLVSAVDSLLVRTRVLLRISGLLALALIALFVLVLTR